MNKRQHIVYIVDDDVWDSAEDNARSALSLRPRIWRPAMQNDSSVNVISFR